MQHTTNWNQESVNRAGLAAISGSTLAGFYFGRYSQDQDLLTVTGWEKSLCQCSQCGSG